MTSSSISSASTPSPTPTLRASSPSFAAPTNWPSASCTRGGNTASAGTSDTVSFFTAVPPSIFGGSPRTLPTGADEAGGTAVKFYELRDNLVRPVLDHQAMAQNFLTCDREQPLLLPPDLHDWLEEDHLAWFVIQSIEELDLDAFYASYRADGHGRAAHDPKMMLTLLTYAYCVGERSSRGIERRCREDVALPGDL